MSAQLKMNKSEYKSRIRVVLVDKMKVKTYLVEKFGVSNMTVGRWCPNIKIA